jgi:Domain of unknown function (DUF5668)/Cell wall-active antibiotics response 4TMS YvqF
MTPQANGSGFDASGMSSDANTNLTPQLAIGIFIILAGVFLALDSLNVLEVEGFFRLWPAVIIAVGGSMLAKRDDPKSRFWGGVLVFLGSWLLLNTLGLVRVGFWDLFWPLLLIGLGVKLVMRAMNLDARGGATAGTNLFAVMGEHKRTNSDHPFRGGQMTAFMGGCQLDLRAAAIFPGEEAVIDILAVMGGLEVWVPGSWTVVSQVVPIMGGVEDKRLPMPAVPAVPMGTPGSEPSVASSAPARLVLRGYVMMGGLVIKN